MYLFFRQSAMAKLIHHYTNLCLSWHHNVISLNLFEHYFILLQIWTVIWTFDS